jgi:hypothetical protein
MSRLELRIDFPEIEKKFDSWSHKTSIRLLKW